MAIQAGDIVYRITSDSADFDRNMQAMQGRVQQMSMSMTQSLATVGRGMTALGAAMVAPLALGIKTAADFDQAITNAASITGKTGDEFYRAKEKMAALAKTLGETTVFTARDAANAFYDLSSKGFDVASMSLEELRPILDLAAATQADLTLATETATSTLRAFGLENSDMTRVSDVMVMTIGKSAATIEKLSNSMNYAAPVAKAAGISIEEVNAHLAQLYNAGLDGSMAGTALRGTLMELMSPSEQLKSALESVGMTTDDVSLSSHSFNEVLQALSSSGISSADMLQIFGARAGPAALMLLETTSGAKELTAALQNAGGIAHEVATKQLNTLWGQLKMMLSALEGVIIPIGEALIPALKSLVEFVTPLIASIAELVRLHPDLTAGILGVVGSMGLLFLAVGPLLMSLPGLAVLFHAITALLGAGGLAGAATSAAPAITGVGTAAATAAGATGIGALTTSLAAIVWPAAAGVAIVAGIAAIAYAAISASKAFVELSISEQKVLDTDARYTQSLREQGLAFNEAAMAAMNHAAKLQYGADVEKQIVDETARAWFQHFSGRAETEKEFANMRALLMNKNISAEEAAIAISKGMNEQAIQDLMRADQQKTEEILNNLGVREKAEQQTILDITKEEMSAALERNNIWLTQTHQLVEYEKQKAQEVGSTWGSMLAEIGKGLISLPVMAGDFMRGLVGMPALGAKATGGPVSGGHPYLVGERGPELFVPRVSGSILSTPRTAAAIGGSTSININMGGVSMANDMDVDAVARRLGDKLRQRLTGVGASNDWRR